MAQIHETTMTLRFFGDDLDPDEITARLGCPPTVGAPKGGTWTTKGGAHTVIRTGTWRLTAKEQQPGDLDVQIADLLAMVSDDFSVWADLTSRFQADIFCGIWMKEGNEGAGLSVETLKSLCSRNLRVEFDIYDPA